MRLILSFILISLLGSFSAQETITYPYNPDGDTDGYVFSPDLLDLLSAYGNEFSPTEIFVDGVSLGDYLINLSTLVEAIGTGSATGEFLRWNQDTQEWEPELVLENLRVLDIEVQEEAVFLNGVTFSDDVTFSGNHVTFNSQIDFYDPVSFSEEAAFLNNVNVQGGLTVTNGVTGNLTGNVTGNLTGNVTGNLTGDISGNAETVTNGIYNTSSVTDLSDVSSAGSGSILTSSERTKLSGIASGAEVNVPSNWNAGVDDDGHILNKPTIPNSSDFVTATAGSPPQEIEGFKTFQNRVGIHISDGANEQEYVRFTTGNNQKIGAITGYNSFLGISPASANQNNGVMFNGIHNLMQGDLTAHHGGYGHSSGNNENEAAKYWTISLKDANPVSQYNEGPLKFRPEIWVLTPKAVVHQHPDFATNTFDPGDPNTVSNDILTDEWRGKRFYLRGLTDNNGNQVTEKDFSFPVYGGNDLLVYYVMTLDASSAPAGDHYNKCFDRLVVPKKDDYNTYDNYHMGSTELEDQAADLHSISINLHQDDPFKYYPIPNHNNITTTLGSNRFYKWKKVGGKIFWEFQGTCNTPPCSTTEQISFNTYHTMKLRILQPDGDYCNSGYVDGAWAGWDGNAFAGLGPLFDWYAIGNNVDVSQTFSGYYMPATNQGMDYITNPSFTGSAPSNGHLGISCRMFEGGFGGSHHGTTMGPSGGDQYNGHDEGNSGNDLFTSEVIDMLFTTIDALVATVKFGGSFLSIFDPEDVWSCGFDMFMGWFQFGMQGYFDLSDLGAYGGISLDSGNGDYAEWLKKENVYESLSFGDIVGVRGGAVSKEMINPDQHMVVSLAPVILGNLPEEDDLWRHEKIAFMGQVMVKVYGECNVGDFILPSGANDGIGIAIPKEKMKAKDYSNIVGVAWENWNPKNQDDLYQYINVAVGINHNNLSEIVSEQGELISQIFYVLNELQRSIKEMDNSYVGYDFQSLVNNTNTPSQNSFNYASDERTTAEYSNNTLGAPHGDTGGMTYDGKTFETKEEFGEFVIEEFEGRLGLDLNQVPLLKKVLRNPELAEEMQTKSMHLLESVLAILPEECRDPSHTNLIESLREEKASELNKLGQEPADNPANSTDTPQESIPVDGNEYLKPATMLPLQ